MAAGTGVAMLACSAEPGVGAYEYAADGCGGRRGVPALVVGLQQQTGCVSYSLFRIVILSAHRH